MTPRDAHGGGGESGESAVGAGGATGEALQCMEVWGGNGASDNGVMMAGVDAWVYSRPYEGHTTGGDVHYVSTCSTGRISRMMVADVAGHGPSASAAATALRDLMRRHVNHLDQSRLVERLNREFGARAKEGVFATAVVATYFAPTRSFVVVNAGHPRPLVYSARTQRWGLVIGEAAKVAGAGGATGRRREAEAMGGAAGGAGVSGGGVGVRDVPLGILEDTAYEQFAVRLRPGDLVVMYTDSLVETLQEDGEQLGERGLSEVAATLDLSKPERVARGLYEAVRERCGREPADDVTVMVLRPNGLLPRPTLGQQLGAQFRFLRLVFGSWRKGARPVPWPEARIENLLGAVSGRLSKRYRSTDPEL